MKNHSKRNKIIIGILIVVGVAGIFYYNFVVRRPQVEQELNVEQQEQALERVEDYIERVEQFGQEYDEDLNKMAANPPTTILGTRGHVYYQSDSVYGAQIREAADFWNDELKEHVFVPVATGQYTTILFTDSTLPYAEDNPIDDVIFTSGMNLAFVNVPHLTHHEFTRDEITALFIQQMGTMLGLDEETNVDVADGDGVNDLTLGTDVKEELDNIRADAEENYSFYPSMMPFRPDLNLPGIRMYMIYTEQHENLFTDKSFAAQSLALDRLFRQIEDGIQSEDGMTAREINELGIEMLSEYQKIIESEYENIVWVEQDEFDALIDEVETTGVATLTSTESTLGIEEVQLTPDEYEGLIEEQEGDDDDQN